MVPTVLNLYIVNIICPLLGLIICIATAFAPIPAVLQARQEKKLGDINPIPFAALVNSNAFWTIYGIIHVDYWLFFSSCIPLLMSLVLCSTAIHLLEREGHTELENLIRMRVESVLFGTVCLLIVLGFICGMLMKQQIDFAVKIFGLFCTAGLSVSPSFHTCSPTSSYRPFFMNSH